MSYATTADRAMPETRAAYIPVDHARTESPASSKARQGTILIATINRPLGDTGVHVHTRVLSEGFGALAFPCEVVSPFSGSRAWLPLFAVRPLILKRINPTWGTRWYRYWHGKALKANLRRRLQNVAGPAAVVAQCPVSAQAALELRSESGGRWPILLVCHFNHSEAREYRDKHELNTAAAYDKMLATEDAVLRGVDHVVYVSGWARDVVQKERGIAPRNSTVVWNGLPDVTTSDRDTRRSARAALGLGDDDLVLLNVGTLEPRKNQIGLLDLFAKVAAAQPQARLILVGDGPQRQLLKDRVEQLGLQAQVKLLGMRRDVPELMHAADIYVHFATAENCPVVLIEAARAALPIAAAPVGGIPELIQQIGAGVSLDLKDPAVAAEALLPLLRDVALRRDLGAKARVSFERDFSREAMVRQYLQALGLEPQQS